MKWTICGVRACSRGLITAVVLSGALLSGCGGHSHSRARDTTRAGSKQPSGARPRLTDSHPCHGIDGFTCSTLTVPLDHGGQADGALRLAVGAENDAAPKGVLLFLSGGPGQPGVALIPRIQSQLGRELSGYRLVMFDQRGTGARALSCPALQMIAGSSDLAIAPTGTVAACARRIGADRRYYTTPETLADIDELRQALGAQSLTLDGVSYGTFVAERYALAYPHRAARLVLDSVVPQQGADPLYLAALRATARVLRSVCAQQRCTWDPAMDVAAIVRANHDGPELLNALVAESVAFPTFPGILATLHAAAAGDTSRLKKLIEAVDAGDAAPAQALSQGLHESTLCLDLPAPWDPRSSTADRTALIARLGRRLTPTAVFPFDRATATGNGIVKGCLEWPPTAPPSLPAGDPGSRLPHIPVLLFAGERDLSTPLAWTREEAARAPDGELVSVPGAGHSVQLRARDPAVHRILAHFLGG